MSEPNLPPLPDRATIDLPPLPQPFAYLYCWDYPGYPDYPGYRRVSTSAATYNGHAPNSGEVVYTTDQMHAYARAAIEADRAGRGEPVAIVLKGSLDNLREYGHIGAPMFTPGNEPEQEWCVPLYTHPPAMRDSAREAMLYAIGALSLIRSSDALVVGADVRGAIDALRAAAA